MLDIHHGDVPVTRQQLGRRVALRNVLASGTVDGVPCVIGATNGDGGEVYIRHALTGELMRSLPSRENARCVCIDRSGKLVLFGTQTGVQVGVACKIDCYQAV